MKWTEWLFATSLVFIGLTCLTMSATWMFNPDSIQSYFNAFVQICLWAAIPVILAAVFYIIIRKRKGKLNENDA